MPELLRVAILLLVSLIGMYLGWWANNRKVHISGRLVIDTTGEKDRWTIFFDDDLGDVEKMDKVVLRIERIE